MNKLNLSHIASSLINDKWLLHSTVHNNLCKTVDRMMEGPLPPTYGEDEKEFEFKTDASESNEPMTAIISVNGIMMKGCSPADEAALGLVNTDFIAAAIDQAQWDNSVSEIVLFFNSPGGSTVGIEELGRKIKSCTKPVYAWTETICASAAYWMASQAQAIGMTPSATIGNVGVYSLIEDNSKQLEMAGVNIQAISSGKYKLMGHPFNPLTDEEKKILQDDVNKQHEKFKRTIQSSRSIASENLEGLSYEGDDALKFFFVDVVADNFTTFLTTIHSMGSQTETELNMKSYTKQAKEAKAPEVAVAAEKVAMSAEKEMPGVPAVKEDVKKAEDKSPEAEPITSTHKISCPACKHEFDFTVPGHQEESDEDKEKEESYPKTYDEEDKVDEKKKESDENTPVKTDVNPTEDLPDKEKPEEEKKNKKAILADINGWRQSFGQSPVTKNAFAEAAIEFVKNFKK